MRPLACVPLVLVWCVASPACEDACTGTERETANGACEPLSPITDTDSNADTDTNTGPEYAGTLTADVTPSVGDPYTFDAARISGGFIDSVLWAFSAVGPAASDFLAFEIAGEPGTGDYIMGTPDHPNFGLYADLTNLGSGAVLGSAGGSLALTRWEAAHYELGEAYLADGTFEMTFTDGVEPTPLTVTMTGSFTDVWMVGDAYQSR
jgi:hypothetical protein